MEVALKRDGNGEEATCPICRQTFFSEKSLHGHMRKHPERSWRGMRPPHPPPTPPPPPPPPNDEPVYVARHLVELANSQFRFACEKCGRQFKSYQALGGHKSHHGLKSTTVRYMERPQGFDSGQQSSSSAGGGEVEKGKMKAPLNFDLNELPPPEET